MSDIEIPEPYVDGSSIAEAIRTGVRRFMVLTEHQLVALTLWVLHTHSFGASDTTPYVIVTSAQKGSGKSRLLEVLKLFVAKPWYTCSPSEAVLARKIAADQPTILLDEIDGTFGHSNDKADMIRSLLNEGNRRDGVIPKNVPDGKGGWVPEDFPVFCPKAYGGIDTGRLPDTLLDRSIVLRTRRKLPSEQVESFRIAQATEQAAPIREMAKEWGSQNFDLLTTARPEPVDDLSDRANDGWEPLLAIAERIGGDWPAQAREAAIALYRAQQRLEDSTQLRLLRAIRDVFEQTKEDMLTSKALCSCLNALDDVDWDPRPGGSLSTGKLAALLRPFEIAPRQLWFGNGSNKKQMRGYERDWFLDAWERYLTPMDKGGIGVTV